MWRWYRRANSSSNHTLRRLTTSVRRRIEDEGDWNRYSPEWWGSESGEDNANVVLRETSDYGNGVVSVLAYPSSKPSAVYWPATERRLNERYAEVNPNFNGDCDSLRILGYQWRVLRFNGNTRQSAVKVIAASDESNPETLYLAQQGLCLAVPYLKSMVSAGFASLASCNYELMSAVNGDKPLRVLCIGHGGGSLPLFLASTIPGAVVDIVEIDPLVISTSIKAMGFPSFSVASQHGQHCVRKPDVIDDVLWRGIHERLFLIESDAENFMLNNSSNIYDIVFIDAYDGDDIFPHKLWDPHSPFLKALESRLHPEHGTVVVNLHSDADITDSSASVSSLFDPVLPMGKYVSAVCQAYKNVLIGKHGDGIAFAVGVPYVCNTSLVVSRGFRTDGGISDRDSVLNTMFMKSVEVEKALDLPFSCLEYINLRRRFVVLD